MKCPNCNGPTIPGFLVNSFYCKAECDLKKDPVPEEDGELWYTYLYSKYKKDDYVETIHCYHDLRDLKKYLKNERHGNVYRIYTVTGTFSSEQASIDGGYFIHDCKIDEFIEVFEA